MNVQLSENPEVYREVVVVDSSVIGLPPESFLEDGCHCYPVIKTGATRVCAASFKRVWFW